MKTSVIFLMMIIMVIFYLVQVTRWQHIRRPKFFLLGTLAIIVSLLVVGCFALSSRCWLKKTICIISTVFTAISFGCAILSCYQGKLPENCLCSKLDEGSESSETE